jgi:hypothetical protein
VRLRLAALAALTGLVAGCTGFAFVLAPPPQFVGVETWTEVPAEQKEVRARVGDRLYLPLGPTLGARGGLPFLYTVTVNDQTPEDATYCEWAAQTWYVFKAAGAGAYRVESDGGFGNETHRVWRITVAP